MELDVMLSLAPSLISLFLWMLELHPSLWQFENKMPTTTLSWLHQQVKRQTLNPMSLPIRCTIFACLQAQNTCAQQPRLQSHPDQLQLMVSLLLSVAATPVSAVLTDPAHSLVL